MQRRFVRHLEARLAALLAGIPEGERAIIIREMKSIALESYRNGQKASVPQRREVRQRPRPSGKARQ